MAKLEQFQNYQHKFQQYFYKYHSIPSLQQACELFGFSSKAAAFKVYQKFVEQGLLIKQENKYLPGGRLWTLPVFESVRAGFPSYASDENSYDLNIHEHLVHNPISTVMISVKGDSMIDAWILSWDTVVVDRSVKARIWHIVVAIIDGDYTLKYLDKNNLGQFFLRAWNSQYPDLHAQEVLEIFGVVVGSFRSYH